MIVGKFELVDKVVVMPAKVEWDDEARTIIRIDLVQYTWPEYHDAVQQVVTEAGQQPHRVDIIVHNPSDPAPGNPLPHLRTSIRQFGTIPNVGMVVAITSRRLPGFIRALVDTVLCAYGNDPPQRAAFADSLDEARQRIYQDREKSAKA